MCVYIYICIIIKMTFDRIECSIENYSMLYFVYENKILLKAGARGMCIEMTHVSLLSSMSLFFRIMKLEDIFKIFNPLPYSGKLKKKNDDTYV